jgi:signal transduction histidine kinase
MRGRNSLRWRLSVSYVVIALVTALVLAGVLLLVLNSYYLQQERRYLVGNASTIGIALQLTDRYDLPTEAVQAQVEAFSLFTQTRVRLLDAHGNTVADSGSPIEQHALTLRYEEQGNGNAPASVDIPPFSGSGPAEIGQNGDSGEESGSGWWLGDWFSSGPAPEGEEISGPTPDEVDIFSSVTDGEVVLNFPAVGSFYGFYLDWSTAPEARRSAEILTVPIPNESGAMIGYVELSEAPAYGREIIRSVAWGLGLASSAGVVLAAVMGGVISRRISVPVLKLAETTTRMAGGELSTRADLDRSDEIGLLARSFNMMAGRIEETITTLRRFASDASHELFTPITALRGNLELAIAEPQNTEHLTEAVEQLDRLESLSSSLLDLSRLESQADRHNWSQVDLGTIVARIVEPFAAQAEQADLTLDLDIGSGLYPIRAYEGQIEQLFGNLINNALKFTPPGGEVRVALHAKAGFAQIVVGDTGIGIPADDLPNLFERFHRGRNASSYAGNGLGLAIAMTIVKHHRGEIWAEHAGTGTRFIVRLPLNRELQRHPNKSI